MRSFVNKTMIKTMCALKAKRNRKKFNINSGGELQMQLGEIKSATKKYQEKE